MIQAASFALAHACFAFNAFMFVWLTGPPATLQAQQNNQPEIHIGGAVLQWPDEILGDAPFTLAGYYDLDPDDNRGPLYLEVFIEYASEDMIQYTTPIEELYVGAEKFLKNRKVKKNFRRLKPLQKRMSNLPQGFQFKPNIKIKERDRKILNRTCEAFDPAFEKLALAQETRKNCFIPRKVFMDGEIEQPIRFLARVLKVRFALDSDDDKRLDELKTILHLINDGRKLGDDGVQNSLQAIEDDCFNKIVRPMLESKNQSPEHLVKLINILREYKTVRVGKDPALESAKRYYLVCRKIIMDLRDKQYRKDTRSSPQTYDEALEIWNRISYISMQGDLTKRLPNRWNGSSRPAAEIAEVAELVRLANVTGERARHDSQRRMEVFLANRILEMTPADFERDLNIMKTRYRQIENACLKPFPDSTRELNKIVNSWTIEDDWKQSPLLLWCMIEPMPRRVPGMMNVNVHLGVAAIKLWLMKNAAVPAKDMDVLLKAVEDARPLQDPHSSDELRFEVNGANVKVYSVGYNGIDDGDISVGKRTHLSEFPYAYDAGVPEKLPDGNLIFSFDFK